VYDEINADSTGYMLNWTMTLFGEMDPAFEGEPIHRPDVNHDTTNDGTTSVIKPSSSATSSQSKETHAPARPTRVKPVTTTTASSTSETVTTTTSLASITPTSHMDDNEAVSPGGSAADKDDNSDHSVFIYAFVGTAAILGLATAMYLHKRKDWRAPSLPRQTPSTAPTASMDYEFDELKPEEEDEDDDHDDYEEGESSDARPLLSQQQQEQHQQQQDR
jgi:kexin